MGFVGSAPAAVSALVAAGGSALTGLFVGDDWAEDHHDIEIVNEYGRRLARRRLPEGLDGVTRLHALIASVMPKENVVGGTT